MAKKPTKRHYKKIIPSLLIAIPFIFFAIAIFCRQQPTNSQLFWSAIEQNLITSSVTKLVTHVTDDTKVQEKTDMQFKPQLAMRKTTTVSQQTQSVISTVTTESIGTKDADFIRYTKLFSSYHGGLENQLNKWASDNDPATGQPSYLKKALLTTPLIFGYVSTSQRHELMTQLKNRNVYTVSESDISKVRTSQGIVAYDIPVIINWNEFTTVYKQYLEMIGLTDMAQSITAPSEPTIYNATVSIKPSSRHIVSLRFSEPYGIEQIFDNYDKTLFISIPQSTELTAAELQKSVQEQVR